jgi:hypothetical protein
LTADGAPLSSGAASSVDPTDRFRQNQQTENPINAQAEDISELHLRDSLRPDPILGGEKGCYWYCSIPLASCASHLLYKSAHIAGESLPALKSPNYLPNIRIRKQQGIEKPKNRRRHPQARYNQQH